MEDRIGLCSLGMFIIDEIEYTGSRQRQQSVIGGAGTYAAIGARLVAGKANARLVGWIVDIGSDFPPEFRSTIEAWQTNCLYREDISRLTTRAWNGYGPNDHRAFRYLTPKIRLDHKDLSRSLLLSDSFHFVCSSERLVSLVNGIMERRSDLSPNHGVEQPPPLFVWEPVPDLCVPEELERFQQAIRLVDVVSPNAEELASFFASGGHVLQQSEIITNVLSWGIGPHRDGVLVVRDGSRGCSAYSRQNQLQLRPYHLQDEISQSQVVDPTGGGNTFLGALGMAMAGKVYPSMAAPVGRHAKQERQPWEALQRGWGPYQHFPAALIYATVAASYAIEQVGTPLLSGESPAEPVWNGESFEHRLAAYIDREKDHVIDQWEKIEKSSSLQELRR